MNLFRGGSCIDRPVLLDYQTSLLADNRIVHLVEIKGPKANDEQRQDKADQVKSGADEQMSQECADYSTLLSYFFAYSEESEMDSIPCLSRIS